MRLTLKPTHRRTLLAGAAMAASDNVVSALERYAVSTLRLQSTRPSATASWVDLLGTPRPLSHRSRRDTTAP
jgi:hypothetical protein